MNRTDRSNRFYEGPDNPGLVLLHDILMTYCMWDFDLGESRAPRPRGDEVLSSLSPGYVQGMSDLLSPILYVMENEVDAFWCFVSFMDQMVSRDVSDDLGVCRCVDGHVCLLWSSAPEL